MDAWCEWSGLVLDSIEARCTFSTVGSLSAVKRGSEALSAGVYSRRTIKMGKGNRVCGVFIVQVISDYFLTSNYG